MRKYNFEPLELVGEDGVSSVVVAAINEDTKLMNYAKRVFVGITLDESTVDRVYDEILTNADEVGLRKTPTKPGGG